MLDLRKNKNIDLTQSKCLKNEATFQFEDEVTKKKLVAKFIANYDDEGDVYLLTEFKKIALLSAEPEIATVYFLATGNYGEGEKSCYIMDFIKGKSLAELIEQNDSLSFAIVIDLLSQIANGLEKAHHYEISHGDLHEGNIMIDNFGNVKLIDFLWWDFKLPFDKNIIEDIKAFKELGSKLKAKLVESDIKISKVIFKNIDSITSFKGLAKNIDLLYQVSNELSLIDDFSTEILSIIISQISPGANLMYVLQEKNRSIPEKLVPEINEKEKRHMEFDKDNRLGIAYQDTRRVNIEGKVRQLFKMKLHQLKQAGFLDWECVVGNSGEKFVGPYVISYNIFFTVKLFKWKRMNEELNFLIKSERGLLDAIFSD